MLTFPNVVCLAVGIFEIGCAFGAITLGFLGNRFGRRKNIFIGTLITMVGIVLKASSFSLAQLIVARFINGGNLHSKISKKSKKSNVPPLTQTL
jgi:MFS family permease